MKSITKSLFALSIVSLLASCTSAVPASSSSSNQTTTPAITSTSKEESSSVVTSISSEVSSSSTGVVASSGETITPTLSKYRTFYQLLVYSFADGNNDGVGDFKGIIDHLDYLQNLGIRGLYLSPIHQSASYHGYDIIDFYSVHDKFEVTVNNVKYDLAKLISECHKRDINVVLDMVLNHSHWTCPWKNQHPNWYKTPNAFYGMEDFNFDNQELRNEIKNVGKYWLEKGVDGFRLDAAKWIYNKGDTNAGVDHEKNYQWWQEFYSYCQGVKSDVYMIGEVLSDQSEVISYYNTKMDSTFNFGMRGKIESALGGNATEYVTHVVDFQQKIREINPLGIESSLISNHDIGRYNQAQRLAKDKTIFAGFLNVLAPGNSYVYYGDELGMTGDCEGARPDYWFDLCHRTPMPFDNGKTSSQNYMYGPAAFPSKNMTSTTISGASAETDAANKNSIYASYAKAIKAKNAADVLYHGKVSKKETKNNAIGAFVSSDGDKKAMVIVNAAPSSKEVTLNKAPNVIGEGAARGENITENNALTMMPNSFFVLNGDYEINEVKDSSVNPPEESGESVIVPDAFGSEVTEEKDGQLILHAYDTNKWGKISCYAWVGNKQYLGGWPGTAMTKNGDWYTITIPKGASNVIFNNGSGQKQTVNLFRQREGEFYFLMEEGSGKVSGDWYTQNPLG